MADEALLQYSIAVQNLIKRGKKVIAFKEKGERERAKLLKELNQLFAKLDVKECQEKIKELEALSKDKIFRSIDTFIRVLEHHVDMARRFLKLPRDQYIAQAEKLLNFYVQIAQEIRRGVVPIVKQEIEALASLYNTLGLRDLKRYEELYKKELELFDALHEKAKIELNTVTKGFKAIRKWSKKVDKVKQNYPRTLVFLEITGSIVIIVTGFSIIAKSIGFLKLFSKPPSVELANDLLKWSSKWISIA